MAVHVISVVVQDGSGAKRAMNLYCADSETPADIQTFLTAHIPKLDDIVGGVIIAASLTQAMVLPGGLDTPALADHPVKWGGLFGFSATGTQYRHGIYVPSILHTLVSEGGSIPDAGAIATWEASVLSGEAAIALTNKHEQPLAAFLGGEQRDRKSAS